MRDIFYEELKKRCEEIRQMQQTGTPDEILERNQSLLEVIIPDINEKNFDEF